MRMSYADGSGNSYVIEEFPQKSLEYNPVKPEFSSSGEYDGGTHVKKELSKEQFSQIHSVFKKAIDDIANHTDNRVKRSGLIIFQESGKDISCILHPESRPQREIESLLKKLIEI